MGIQNKDGALYFATGIDNTGLYKSRREAIGIIKAMADEITSFDVFGGIGISAGIAFARAAKESYDFEKRFQKAMLEVATLSKEVDGSLTEYMNRVMDMIRDIPIAGDEAAKALYQIVSAGHDGANGMKILEVSAKAATGGLTETATAADAITTILNAYGMQADKAKSVSDKLFTTVRLGKTTFGELGTSIAQAAPIAASFGISLDDVLAAVATITKQGVPTSEAMTKIRAAILGTANQLGDAAFQGRTFQEALQLKEKRELDDVFSALARAKEGTEERRKVINLINGQYGSYLSNMLTEKSSAEEIKSAYDRINASLKEKIALQIQNQATDEIATSGVKKQADELENLRKGLSQYSNNDGLVELTVQNIVDKVTEAQRAGIGNRKVFWDLQRELVNGIAKDAKELNDEVVEALDEYIRSVYSTEYNIYQAKKRFAPFIKGLTSVNTGTTTTTTTTTGTTVVNTEPDKKDYKGDIENAKKEQGKLFEQFSMDLQQMRIDAMEEGEEKYQAQRRLDFQKELFSIKEHGEALIKAQQEIEKKQWEERNKGKKNNEKGVFKPTTTSIEQLPQEQKDLLSNMYSEAQVKNLMNEEKILKEKYDALIAQLDDYKSREYTITKEWDEKIAQAAGNEELVDKLTKGKEKALNELNAQMLMQSDEWVKLFGDLDNLTISEIENLIQIIKSKAKDLKLDPINLDKVLEKLKDAENEIKSRNPFRSLVSHIKEYQQEADKTKKKASLKEIFGDTSEVLGMVNECFDSVIGGLKNMGLAGDEETQKLLGSISNMVGSAGKLADGIASMNPATMISGAVGLISSAFDVFDRRSRKANRAIKQHQENVKNLEKQYRQLERETAKAIGSEKYSKQIEQVNNLQQKIIETEGMIAAEQSKRSKKRDDGKIADWESQIEDYRDKIDELKQGIVDELSTTDLYSFSNDVASSIIDGLCNGLDSGKEVVQEKINDLMRNVIAKQFDVLVIQNAMEDMFQKMADAVDPTKDGGIGITDWEMNQIVSAGQDGKEEIMNSLGRYKAILERLGLINDDIEDKIENGVTGELQAAVTEGTASQLVGLWNMSALDIRSLLNLSHEHFIECRTQLANIANIYVQIVGINNNTKATADNTGTLVEELKTGIKSLETKLDEIRKNTKNYNGRG